MAVDSSTNGADDPYSAGTTGAGGAGGTAGSGEEKLLAGRYLLGEVLGSGGMGKVWQAEDRLLGRQVAVKELRVMQEISPADLETLHHRMKQEARAAARVNHPGVVTVHDVFEHDGRPWIVMELVEGRSLAEVIDQEGTLLPRDAASVGLRVLEALRAAHDAGVLHRDVKPANVLMARDGRVLLTDFGIATLEGGTSLTRTGALVGSPDYLAPERAVGRRPGPESDLWSLGATLYAAVEGRSPFHRTSVLMTLQAVVAEELPEPVNAGPLGSAIEALLRKDPHERPSHEETARMLREVSEGRPVAPADGVAAGYTPTQVAGPTPLPTPSPVTPAPPALPQTQQLPPAPARTPYQPTPPFPYGVSGSHGAAYPPPATSGRGRRVWLLVAAVAAGASLAGGAVALVVSNQDNGGEQRAHSSGRPSERKNEGGSPSGPGRANSPGTEEAAKNDSGGSQDTSGSPEKKSEVPPGYRRANDPAGFSMAVPDGWTREVNKGQIDYTPDGGRHLLRIGTVPGATGGAYNHFVQLEGEVADRFVNYRQLRLDDNTFRGRPGAIWEFTWTALKAPAGDRHAIDQGYVADNGSEYDLYMASPTADWGTTQRHFQTLLDTWELIP